MKRWALIMALILVLSSVPGWAVRPVTAENNSQVYTMQFEPSDDAYVYEKQPNSNYGLRYYMWVGSYNDGWEYGYLKFNLSSIPWYANITSAKVCLYAMKVYGSPSISVHPVVSDDWNESAITWNNKPDYEETVLDSVTVDGAGKYYCWDVTSFVKQQFSSKVVSLALVPGSQDSVKFYTKDAYESNPHPYLTVTYTAPSPYVPIQEIQSNTTDGDKSAYAGQEVITRGVVTGVTPEGFFIQNGTGPWSGIYVYLGTPSNVHTGDYVEVLGTVQEHYGLTEIKTASENVTVLGTATLPEPVVLQTGEVAQEQWESVLVKVENVAVANPDLGHGEWEVDDGSGPVRVDDLMYPYTPTEGQRFGYIVGVVYYSYGNFKIEPRESDDIVPYVPIQEIQSNMTNGDASVYVGRIVQTEGIITAIGKKEFVIQNGTGPWSGLFIYMGNGLNELLENGIEVGSLVKVTGRIYEYKNLTEMAFPDVETLGIGELPSPMILKTKDVAQEQWESVLVQVENATVKAVNDGYWTVDDGSGEINISTYLYAPQNLQEGMTYKYIRGVVVSTYGDFKIMPRNANDLALEVPEILNLEVPRHYVGEGLINVTIRNNYEVETNVTLRVAVNGDVLYLKNLTLGGNEIRSIPVKWSPSEPGDYTINATLMSRDGEVFDTDSKDVEVHYGIGLKSHEIPKVVLVDEPVEFNFTLFNNYSMAKTVNFTVLINGKPLYSNDSIVLESGEELNLSVPWKAPRYGNYTVNATLKYNGIIVARADQKIYAQYGISPTGKSTIEPTADAYSYYYKGTEFGWRNHYLYKETRYELAVGNSSLFSRERAYLKFDLSSIPEIANVTSAKLCIYAFYVKSPMEVGVYAVDSSWSEEKKPKEPPKLGDLINVTVMERGNEWYCWDVTNYVRDEASGDGIVSVALRMTNESQNNLAWIASRENPDNRPYLNVTYSIPMEIKNFENVTVAVVGNANVSSENGTIIVELDGESYTFLPSSTNVFVNATGFNPEKPSLLAYWKATLTGYSSEPAGESTHRINARQIVKTATTKVTIDLAMAEDGTAVLVIPLQGDKVAGVGVVKDGENITLHENATDDEIGYYYITGSHLVVVLKKDPTRVVVTFESKKIIESPTAISTLYGVSLYYSRYLHRNDPYLEGLYANFTNLTAELKKYNVALGNVPVEEINEMMRQYRENLTNVPEDAYAFSKYKTKVYSIFTHARQAFLLYKELTKKLELWNPVLEQTLVTARELYSHTNQSTEGLPSNQTAENQTPVIVVPTPSEEISVLIDASHGQYYVTKKGIEYLLSSIENDLGWKVTANYDSPLTYDLLKEYTVLILTDPKDDLSDAEIEAIQKFVENGGGLLITGEWYKYANVENFNRIVGKYGITFNDDELEDDDQNSGRSYYPFVGVYNKDHPAMKFVPDGWKMYYNGDTLTISGDAVWLIKAYDTGYSVDANGNVVQVRGTNPVIAAAVDLGNGRIVAYGSSKALSDDYYQKYIKSSWPFIKGVLLWLAHQE